MQIWKIGGDTIKKVRVALEKGSVLVCPTDTVYGLLADAANKRAVRKVYQIKKRTAGKPLPLFVKDIRMAKNLAYISQGQERFLKKVWPGKVTAVLKAKMKGSVGLRIPKHRFIAKLLKTFPRPITGTSANLAGKKPARSVEEVLKQFSNKKHQPDIVIDAGKLPFSRPSKVIDLRGNKKKILRP